MIRQPPISPLFPYTTLFRSVPACQLLSAALASSNRCVRRSRPRSQRLSASSHPGERAARLCTASQKTENRGGTTRSEEHTSELQSRLHLVCRLLLEKKKNDS